MKLLNVSGKITYHAINPTSMYFSDFSVDCTDGQKIMVRKVYGPEAKNFSPNSEIKAILRKEYNSEDGEHWVIIASELLNYAGKRIMLHDILSPNWEKASSKNRITPAVTALLAFCGLLISVVISYIAIYIIGALNKNLSHTFILCFYGISAILGAGLFIKMAYDNNRGIEETKRERAFLLEEVKKQGFHVDESVYTEY